MKYKIIYADPPWSYRDKALAGNRGACCKYPVMAFEDIARLPVRMITDDDSVLFLWATFPKMDEALALIPRWGFEFKTCAFTWVKTNPVSGTPFFGMGSWTRANAEVCLLATKGKPKRISASVSQIIISRTERHSKKPDEVRERIVKLVGDVPRLEMFARASFPGWDRWGNQVESSIVLGEGA